MSSLVWLEIVYVLRKDSTARSQRFFLNNVELLAQLRERIGSTSELPSRYATVTFAQNSGCVGMIGRRTAWYSSAQSASEETV
jgi:hypothetical protein